MATQVDSLLFHVAENGYQGSSPIGYKDVRTVNKLPRIGESGIIYKVPKQDPEGNNLFNEYVWTGIDFKLFMENVDETATAGGDANTTYELSLDPSDPHTVVLTGSDGSKTSATVEDRVNIDTNTTYTLNVADGKITFTPSNGEATTFELPIQDVSGFATKEEVEAVKESIPAAYDDTAIKAEIDKKMDAVTLSAVATSGSYNDLIDKPTIPEAYDDSGIKTALDGKVNVADIATVAKTGAYSDLSGTPVNVSEFTNDADYASKTDAQGYVVALDEQLSAVAKSGAYSDITGTPTKLSDFENDKNFVTKEEAAESEKDTTYTFAQNDEDKHIITLTDSTGATQSVTTVDTVYDDTDLRAKVEAIEGKIPVDTNTTYTIEQDANDGHKFALVGSDGTRSEITIPDVDVDTNTTYTLSLEGDKITLTPSEGDAMTFTIPVQDITGLATKEELKEVEAKIEPDTNTTYTLTQGTVDAHNIILTDSLGGSQTITTVDTVYDDSEIKKEIAALSEVARTGSYNDLSDKPIIPAAYDDTDIRGILEGKANAADLATVARTGSYNDLTDVPVIPEAYDDTILKEEVDKKANSSDLSAVATTGSYNDLKDTPVIPEAYDDTALVERIEALEKKVAELEAKIEKSSNATISETGVVDAADATIDDNGTVTIPSATIDANGVVTI